MDSAVDRLAWQRQVPIEFTLAVLHDEAAERPDEPCYMMVPCVAYLPFCLEQLVEHFGLPYHAQLLSSQRHEPGILAPGEYSSEGSAATAASQPQAHHYMLWFEYEDMPLRWHLPVGVLFDAHTQGSMSEPWKIKVHTKNYPLQVLAPCVGPTDVERIFFNRLKEATYIKHGTINLDPLMSSANLKQLWSGLLHDDFDEFNEINSRLAHSSHLKGEYFQRLPFVVYIVDKGNPARQVKEVVQEPFDILDHEGVCWTLGDLLLYLFQNNFRAAESRASIHGIQPPLDTPLQWLALHLSYADNFVHIIVDL